MLIGMFSSNRFETIKPGAAVKLAFAHRAGVFAFLMSILVGIISYTAYLYGQDIRLVMTA
jgi:hypothetical protein